MINKGGRPTKLTPALVKKVCNSLRVGCWLEIASEQAGISRESLRSWLRQGNDLLEQAAKGVELTEEQTLLTTFVEDVQQAMADSELLDVKRINKAAVKIWTAAAWRLERRYPERWGDHGRKLLEVQQKLEALQQLLQELTYARVGGQAGSNGRRSAARNGTTPH